MSRPETQNQPSVEELLVSIRQAIHGSDVMGDIAVNGTSGGVLEHNMAKARRAKSSTPSNGAAVSGSMSQTRVSLQRNSNSGHGGRAEQHTENFFKLRNQLQEMGAKSPHVAATRSAQERNQRPVGANGFAGILNGDTRLEEALEKLKRAGLGEAHSEPSDNQYVKEGVGFKSHDIETADNEFSEFEDDYGSEEFDEVHQYAPGPEPEQPQQVEDSFSTLTRKTYLEPVREQVEQFTPPAAPALAAPSSVTAPEAAERPQIAPLTTRAATPLTSDESAAETSAAFNRLADTIIGSATSGERSIDEITRELLRPMLQSWLDEHLPRVVERLVREEIERVSRWGGK